MVIATRILFYVSLLPLGLATLEILNSVTNLSWRRRGEARADAIGFAAIGFFLLLVALVLRFT